MTDRTGASDRRTPTSCSADARRPPAPDRRHRPGRPVSFCRSPAGGAAPVAIYTERGARVAVVVAGGARRAGGSGSRRPTSARRTQVAAVPRTAALDLGPAAGRPRAPGPRGRSARARWWPCPGPRRRPPRSTARCCWAATRPRPGCGSMASCSTIPWTAGRPGSCRPPCSPAATPGVRAGPGRAPPDRPGGGRARGAPARARGWKAALALSGGLGRAGGGGAGDRAAGGLVGTAASSHASRGRWSGAGGGLRGPPGAGARPGALRGGPRERVGDARPPAAQLSLAGAGRGRAGRAGTWPPWAWAASIAGPTAGRRASRRPADPASASGQLLAAGRHRPAGGGERAGRAVLAPACCGRRARPVFQGDAPSRTTAYRWTLDRARVAPTRACSGWHLLDSAAGLDATWAEPSRPRAQPAGGPADRPSARARPRPPWVALDERYRPLPDDRAGARCAAGEAACSAAGPSPRRRPPLERSFCHAAC